MEFQTNFKFLNLQEITRKNAKELSEDEKTFIKLNLLDNQNNPCSFIIFDKNIKEKIRKLQLKSLIDLIVVCKVFYNNNKWNINLVNLDIR